MRKDIPKLRVFIYVLEWSRNSREGSPSWPSYIPITSGRRNQWLIPFICFQPIEPFMNMLSSMRPVCTAENWEAIRSAICPSRGRFVGKMQCDLRLINRKKFFE